MHLALNRILPDAVKEDAAVAGIAVQLRGGAVSGVKSVREGRKCDV